MLSTPGCARGTLTLNVKGKSLTCLEIIYIQILGVMSVKFKKWELKEFLWAVAILTFMLCPVLPLQKLRVLAKSNWDLIHLPFYSLLLLCVLFGFLLGLPALIERWSSNRRFYWAKFLIQGLPALILAMPIFLVMDLFSITSLDAKYIPPWSTIQGISYNGYVFFLSAVWFGKTLVDSTKGYSPEDKDKENAPSDE